MRPSGNAAASGPLEGQGLGMDFHDLLGSRPEGAIRASPLDLFKAAWGLLRSHGVAVAAFSVLVALALWTLFGLFGSATIWFLNWPSTRPDSPVVRRAVVHAPLVAALLVATPLRVGYFYALLRLLQGRRSTLRIMVTAFMQRRLWGRVLVAGCAASVGEFVLHHALKSVPWPGPAQFFHPDSPLLHAIRRIQVTTWLARELPEWISIVAFVPIAWAGVEVLVHNQPWANALKRSVRLARSEWRLAAGFAIVSVACTFLPFLASPLKWMSPIDSAASYGRHLVMGGLFVAASFLASALWVLIEGLALVVVYREMIWRERDMTS